MKRIAIIFTFAILLFGMTGCQGTTPAKNQVNESNMEEQSKDNEIQSQETEKPAENELNQEEEIMRISVKSDDYEIIYELNDSNAAKTLYEQLPLTTEMEPFSTNEMTFYLPQKLDTADTPLSSGEAGTLSYYSPWGDVVMFYDYCNPNGSLYGLGEVVSGKENIDKLTGTITVSEYKGE